MDTKQPVALACGCGWKRFGFGGFFYYMCNLHYEAALKTEQTKNLQLKEPRNETITNANTSCTNTGSL